MKKLALTIVCALATTGVVFAQGYVSQVTTGATGQTNTTETINPTTLALTAAAGGTSGNTMNGNTAGGLEYDYALLYETTAFVSGLSTADLFDGTWQSTGLTFTNASAGKFNPVQNPAASTVPWNNGTTQSIVLVGWSVNLGTSWTGVSGVSNVLATQGWATSPNEFFGVSTFGYLSPNASTPGAAVFFASATANGLPIATGANELYLLAPVPEPATLALAGLGGLSLLLFRRQRK